MKRGENIRMGSLMPPTAARLDCQLSGCRNLLQVRVLHLSSLCHILVCYFVFQAGKLL